MLILKFALFEYCTHYGPLQVASFGGSMLKEGILTLSFAPRDSHKAQIQFVLERGIPAFVLMLGTRRLPFPAFAFDLIHCSRCLIPFTAYSKVFSLFCECVDCFFFLFSHLYLPLFFCLSVKKYGFFRCNIFR